MFRLSGKVEEGDESSGARISRLRISLQVPQHTQRASNHRAQSSGARFRAKYGSRKSRNLTDWTETEVDYRAVATRVMLTRGGDTALGRDRHRHDPEASSLVAQSLRPDGSGFGLRRDERESCRVGS